MRKMHPPGYNVLSMAAVVLIAAGCVQSTSKERDASFAAYAHTEIGHQASKDWLTTRTVIFVTGDGLTVTPSATEPGVFQFGGLHWYAGVKQRNRSPWLSYL